jgi:hypothetical protein
MEQLLPSEIDRIASDLVHTVHKAKWLVDAEAYGEELDRLMLHARELHTVLLTRMEASDDWVTDELRAMCSDMGGIIDQLEDLVAKAWQ